MNRPIKKHPKPPVYDYHEVAEYIEAKHGVKLRDFAGHFNDRTKPYLDFWHWVVDRCDVRNDSYFALCIEPEGEPEWIGQILGWFAEFADEDHIEFWVSW